MPKIFACTLLIIGEICKIEQTDATSSSSTSTADPFRRIIAGYSSDIAWVPYYVYISLKDGDILRTCGGTIISQRWVVTAAHCLYKDRRRISDDGILLYAGTSKNDILDDSVQMRHVIYSIAHGAWDNPFRAQITNHDIALMKTCTVFDYTNEVQPIALAPKNYVFPDGIEAVACGFGDTKIYGPAMKSHDLYAVLLRKRRCWGNRPAQTILCFEGIQPKMSGICHGDSGGPLAYLGGTIPVLIGVSSGTGCKINVGGGTFTDVSLYRDWIREVTRV